MVSLKVIGLTVKKFLQPNLSLLMDSKPGGSIHDLGKLIYMKMHDRHWEIRDTALELLQICTEIAYISKYCVLIAFIVIIIPPSRAKKTVPPYHPFLCYRLTHLTV